MITTIFLILSVIVNLVLLYVTWNLMSKIGTYEAWILNFGRGLTKLYFDIKQVDHMNLFENDDHVGITFKSILGLIEEFNERMGNGSKENNEEEEEDII
jgi:hypothetical protein